MSGKSSDNILVSVKFCGSKILFGANRYCQGYVARDFMEKLTPANDIAINGNKYVVAAQNRMVTRNSVRRQESVETGTGKQEVLPTEDGRKRRVGRKRKHLPEEELTGERLPKKSMCRVDSTTSLYSEQTVGTFPRVDTVELLSTNYQKEALPISDEDEEGLRESISLLIEDLDAGSSANLPTNEDSTREEAPTINSAPTDHPVVGNLCLPSVNNKSRYTKYIPNKNMGNVYVDQRLTASIDVMTMEIESCIDFWVWVEKLKIFLPISPSTHDPSILSFQDIGVERWQRRFIAPLEQKSNLELETKLGATNYDFVPFSSRGEDPRQQKSLLQLLHWQKQLDFQFFDNLLEVSKQCRKWLDQSSYATIDSEVNIMSDIDSHSLQMLPLQEANLVSNPFLTPLRTFFVPNQQPITPVLPHISSGQIVTEAEQTVCESIQMMEDNLSQIHLKVNQILAKIRRNYIENPLFWEESRLVSQVYQERKHLITVYRGNTRRKRRPNE